MTLLTRRTLMTGLATTLATPMLAKNFHADDISHIQIRKSARQLDVIGSGRILKSYDIRLGRWPVGPKRVHGDGKTPEGLYQINGRNPASRYHLSLGISYPNQTDRLAAQALGKSPGGDIVIHGQPNGLRHTLQRDWTLGCIALSNIDIEELSQIVAIGTPILIQPR